MNEQSYGLIPFPAANIPNITISGRVGLRGSLLSLHYSLTGKVQDIFLPPASANPGRKDELWKTTCFEFFLARKHLPQYWEFNLCPSGDWNVYSMDEYRRIGFREEASIRQLPFEIQREAGAFRLNTSVDLSSIIQNDQPLEIGVSAVIRDREGHETYWALRHPAPHADFHLRESFICSLQNTG